MSALVFSVAHKNRAVGQQAVMLPFTRTRGAMSIAAERTFSALVATREEDGAADSCRHALSPSRMYTAG